MEKILYPTRQWIQLPTGATQPGEEGLSFSVMSYNILAQNLIRRDVFNYCSSKCLKWAHRKQTLINEILHWSPDILALQECNHYEEWFKPELRKHGYDSCYKNKTGINKLDGCALFWKKEKFSCGVYQELELDSLAEGLQGFEKEELTRGNVGQIVTLIPKLAHPTSTDLADGNTVGVMIGNTHLFWNPLYNFVRAKQIYTLITAMCKLNHELYRKAYPKHQEETDQQFTHGLYPMLFVGDLNSSPDSIIYHYMTDRSQFDVDHPEKNEKECGRYALKHFLCPPEHGDPRVSHLDAFAGDTPQLEAALVLTEEDIKRRMDEVYNMMKISKTQLPVMASVYSNYTALTDTPAANGSWKGEPAYTVYVPHHKSTLDYICQFKHPADDTLQQGVRCGLVPTGILSIPGPHLIQQAALPNEACPSDHLPIMATFSLFLRTEEGSK